MLSYTPSKHVTQLTGYYSNMNTSEQKIDTDMNLYKKGGGGGGGSSSFSAEFGAYRLPKSRERGENKKGQPLLLGLYLRKTLNTCSKRQGREMTKYSFKADQLRNK